jgi:hypothetical protein
MSDAKIQHGEDCERLTHPCGVCDCEAIALRAEVERLKIEAGQHPTDCKPDDCGKCRRDREIAALNSRVEDLSAPNAWLQAALTRTESERDELAKKLEAYRNRPATLQKAHEVINRLTEKLHQERGTLRYYTEGRKPYDQVCAERDAAILRAEKAEVEAVQQMARDTGMVIELDASLTAERARSAGLMEAQKRIVAEWKIACGEATVAEVELCDLAGDTLAAYEWSETG